MKLIRGKVNLTQVCYNPLADFGFKENSVDANDEGKKMMPIKYHNKIAYEFLVHENNHRYYFIRHSRRQEQENTRSWNEGLDYHHKISIKIPPELDHGLSDIVTFFTTVCPCTLAIFV